MNTFSSKSRATLDCNNIICTLEYTAVYVYSKRALNSCYNLTSFARRPS